MLASASADGTTKITDYGTGNVIYCEIGAEESKINYFLLSFLG